jgi:hypothetical protein
VGDTEETTHIAEVQGRKHENANIERMAERITTRKTPMESAE